MCDKKKKTVRTQGFTLVELSIVIIIIGFLIAGISAGTSLVRQAGISSVISDMQNYQTAYNNFRMRYDAIPGDMQNAETYWPAGTTGCAITAGNCNGNGDGLIKFNVGVPDESASAWRELVLSNMVNIGTVAIPNAWVGVEVLGATVPVSKVTGAGYLMVGSGLVIGHGTSSPTSPWADGVTNAVFIGKISSTDGLAKQALKAEDAFNIDKKIDDGSVSGSSFAGANTGNFRSVNGSEGGVCTAGAGANYDLTQANAGCIGGLALN